MKKLNMLLLLVPGETLRSKRIARSWWSLALCLLVTASAASALQSGDFTYTINPDATSVTISDYTGSGGAVVIPSTIDGNDVTVIGASAFDRRSSLTGITIPNSVTTIEESAFERCVNLTSIILGSSVTSIEDKVFSYCASLTSITIPDGVTSIGGSAFTECTSLTNATIGNGVSTIKGSAFRYCTSLPSISIPGNVTSIYVTAFVSCTNLTAITVDSLNSEYRSLDGVLFNKNQTMLITYPAGNIAESYVIPDGVTEIGGYAFYDCSNLLSVGIPESVTKIGYTTFNNCSSLLTVEIPKNVNALGYGAFIGCTNLTAITVDSLNFKYRSLNGVLFDRYQLTLITYPAGKIAESYVIPDGVTWIGYAAFHSCSNLSALDIPDSVTSIGSGAFSQCTGLTSITIPDSVITSIGNHAFSYCSSLTNVIIGNGVTSIERTAFARCTSLTRVTIPASVTSIGSDAFSVCSSLTGVYCQGDAPSLGSRVFTVAPATVYYKLGTAGWGTTFGDRPTVLWNPLIQTDDSSFGVQAGEFGFNITESESGLAVVEACTNLSTDIWVPVETNSMANGSVYFSDADWANYPGRYYRLSMP